MLTSYYVPTDFVRYARDESPSYKFGLAAYRSFLRYLRSLGYTSMDSRTLYALFPRTAGWVDRFVWNTIPTSMRPESGWFLPDVETLVDWMKYNARRRS